MIDFGYIDIHSHTLWGMDDGAGDIESSVELCRLAHETGTDILFLTPHIVHWEDASALYDAREERARYLQNILNNEGMKEAFECLGGVLKEIIPKISEICYDTDKKNNIIK